MKIKRFRTFAALTICLMLSLTPALGAMGETVKERVQVINGQMDIGDVEQPGHEVDGVEITTGSSGFAVGVFSNEQDAKDSQLEVKNDVIVKKNDSVFEHTAAIISSMAGKTSSLMVDGSIQSEIKNTSDWGCIWGIESYAAGDGSAALTTVNGDVSAQGDFTHPYGKVDGVDLYVEEGGEVAVDIGGDLTVTAKGENATAEALRPENYGGTLTTTIGGNVSAASESGKAQGVSLFKYHDHTGKPDTKLNIGGNLTANGQEESYALKVTNNGSGEITAEIGGDVSATSKAGRAYGAILYGDATLNIGGSLTAEGAENAIALLMDENVLPVSEIVEATIAGGITAESENGYANGAIIDIWKGRADLLVNDGISVKGTSAGALMINNTNAEVLVLIHGDVTAEGVETEKEEEWGRTGVVALQIENITEEGEAGTVDVMIAGNVISSEDGIMFNSGTEQEEGGAVAGDEKTRIEVLGDVTAGNYAVYTRPAGVPFNTDIIVDGTVSGARGSIVLPEDIDTSSLKLTFWKVVPDANGALALWESLDEEGGTTLTQAKEVEKDIQYIIRVLEPEEGGTVSLSGTTRVEGFDTIYNVAREGDKVYLIIAPEDGWKVLDAFRNAEKKLSMTSETDTAWYINVPHGGGVTLSALLLNTRSDKPDQSKQQKPVAAYNYKSAENYDHFENRNAIAPVGKPWYQVLVDAGSGTVDGREAITAMVESGGTYRLPGAEWQGHTFAGWKNRETGDLFEAGTEVTITASTTFDAQWK